VNNVNPNMDAGTALGFATLTTNYRIYRLGAALRFLKAVNR